MADGDILSHLVAASIRRGEDEAPSCPFEDSVARALFSGFHADRLGYAFRGGYRAALGRLFAHAGVPPPSGRVCLAATESGGAHPRAIATRMSERDGALRLVGEKTFVTLASESDEMLVVTSLGLGDDGTNRLVLVRVPSDAPGVSIANRPELPFAPEIAHAIVKLDAEVDASSVLPGDGYTTWLKPFRTIEDVHVLASVVGYLAGVARTYSWDRAFLTELVAAALALVELGASDPSAPLTHLALAGTFASTRRLIASLDGAWGCVEAVERERWQRDLPLLLVAENARRKRTETAFAALRERRGEG